jgi:hypothetical protein
MWTPAFWYKELAVSARHRAALVRQSFLTSLRRTNADKRMRVRWRQSWGDVFDLLLKDRDLGLLLIIAVLGALIGIAALFGVLMYALR